MTYPELDVTVSPNLDIPPLAAGAINVCPGRFADQTTLELTDNASWSMGTHHLTLGTHDEVIHLDGSRRIRVPAGRWAFASLDALEAGVADDYILDFPRPGHRGPDE